MIHLRLVGVAMAALLATSLSGAPAAATLGRGADSVATDGRALGATPRAATRRARFTVHELRREGLTVREYANDAGVIFALAWRGVNHPDLAPLLGDYLGDYDAARARSATARGHDRYRVVTGARVVVVKSGQLPSVTGQAFIPTLLPEGVTPHDLD